MQPRTDFLFISPVRRHRYPLEPDNCEHGGSGTGHPLSAQRQPGCRDSRGCHAGAQEGGGAITLAEKEAHTVGAEDTLHHGETLLVVTARNAELVTLELVAEGVTADLLGHTLVVERKPEELGVPIRGAKRITRDLRRSLAATRSGALSPAPASRGAQLATGPLCIARPPAPPVTLA